MPSFPINWVFWPSLAVLALGVLALVPIWWNGSRTLKGRMRPVTEEDAFDMRFASFLLLAGTMGLIGTGLTRASQTMDQVSFIMVGGAGLALLCIVGFIADARARRHR